MWEERTMNELLMFFYLLLLPAITRVEQPEKGSLPNIVFILADDMGYGDVSSYNPKSRIRTTNIDRLARDGMRFTDAHSGGSSCISSHSGQGT